MLFQLVELSGCNIITKHSNLQTPQVKDLSSPNVLEKNILLEAKSHTSVHALPRQAPKPYCPVTELSHYKQVTGKGKETQDENINPQHSATPQLPFVPGLHVPEAAGSQISWI